MDLTITDALTRLHLSTDEINQYRRRFTAFDINKDGKVVLREFVAVSKVFGYKLSKEEILEIFNRRDLDDSGGITFEEFVIAMHERKQKAKTWAPYREKFWEYDVKNKGYITSDEAFPVLQRELGFDMNKTESLVEQYDKNKDYRLSLPEFIPFYNRVQELKAEVRQAFQDFDKDQDGFVTLEEARALMQPKGFSPDQVEATFQKHDQDQDGRWSYQEFAQFWDIAIFK